MTNEEVLERVESIRRMAWDNQIAHAEEDDLRNAFIAFVAERNDELGELARIVLSTNDIEYDRWYA